MKPLLSTAVLGLACATAFAATATSAAAGPPAPIHRAITAAAPPPLAIDPPASAAHARKLEIASPEGSYQGLGYGEWAALFWQWAFSIPDGPGHPFSPGGNVAQNQASNVWFLPGVFGVEVRDVTIPKGTALFFPIGNAECSTLEPPPFHGDDATELSICANGYGDAVVAQGPTAELDGKSVRHLEEYRSQSPMFTFGPLPDPGLFGLPPGASGQAVDSGIYLLIEPIADGPHTIHFTAYGGQVDTTYNITVAP